MTRKLLCDICKQPITDEEKSVEIAVRLTKGGDSMGMDVCAICYSSPVILSEMRRTRTRKPKRGRPKASARRILSIEAPNDESPVTVTDEGFLDALKPGA